MGDTTIADSSPSSASGDKEGKDIGDSGEKEGTCDEIPFGNGRGIRDFFAVETLVAMFMSIADESLLSLQEEYLKINIY
jgi:hypothetical protein